MVLLATRELAGTGDTLTEVVTVVAPQPCSFAIPLRQSLGARVVSRKVENLWGCLLLLHEGLGSSDPLLLMLLGLLSLHLGLHGCLLCLLLGLE